MIKHMNSRVGPRLLAGFVSLAALSATATSQQARTDSLVSATVKSMLVRYRDAFFVDTATLIPPPSFASRADSLAWVTWRDRATSANDDFRVVVSLFDRQLQVIRGADTLMVAPIAVASGVTLEYAGRSWTFRTPRGQRRVLRKVEDPVWRPPDWLYAEVASEYGLKLQRLREGSSIGLEDGRRLTVRNGVVGISESGASGFVPLPVDEHIVFNSTLYIPPAGTWNRQVPGELGPYALDLGNGYLLHGTPDQTSIGRAVTHGCIRLADPDITWLYDNVPVGTPVYIY
jgi:lipoprotein-anchoring transpeptidase ErfK/SrfK